MTPEQEMMHAERISKLQWTIEDRKNAALAQHRRRCGLTHYTLADACREQGECIRSMNRVTKRDNPTIKSISRLASVLGVSLEWLLSGKTEDGQ